MRDEERTRAAVTEAEALRVRGDFDGAKRRLLQELHVLRAKRAGTAASADETFFIEYTASFAVLVGETRLADLFLDAAAAEREGAGEWWLSDFATLQRVHIALTANALDDARERFREVRGIGSVSLVPDDDAELTSWEDSRPWPRGPGHWRERLFTSAYLELARLFTALGSCERAVRMANRGLRFATAEDAPLNVRDRRVALWMAVVEARLVQGHGGDARSALAAVEVFDPGRYPAWRAQWLALATQAAWLAGDLGGAVEAAREHLRFCSSLGLDHAIAQARMNLAELRLQLNEHSAARELLDDVAVSPVAVLKPEVGARLASLVALCEEHRAIYFDGPRSVVEQIEDRPASAGANREVAAVAPKRDWNVPIAALVDQLLIELRASAGDEARRASLTSELERLGQESDSPLIEARIAFGRGLHAYAEARRADPEQLAAADRFFSQARAGFQALAVPAELYECQRWLSWTWRRLGREEREWTALRRENATLLDRVAATLNVVDRAAFFLNKWGEEEEDLAEDLRTLDLAQKSLGGVAPRAHLQLMNRRNRLLDRIVGVRDAFARTVISGDAHSAGEVRPTPLWRRLLVSPRHATLVFLVLPNAVAVFTVILGRITLLVLPRSRQLIRERVAAYHRGSSTAGVIARDIGLDAALETLPRWIDRLTILADDVLHGVPFAALPFEERPLIHRFAITMAHALARPYSHAGDAEPRAVFAGVSGGRPGQPRLDNAPQLEIVKEALKPGVLQELNDTNCNSETLTAAMAGASLVHITCHGVFDPENAHETGLVLPDGRGGVGLLTLRDLSQQRFAHLRLTTLVSCWSADAYVRPGRWVVSAPETLCRAGAESVIAALWEVDNVRVAPFLRRLYHHLKTQPCDKALRLAQLEASESLLPYVWAAFQLHGSRKRIRWRGLR